MNNIIGLSNNVEYNFNLKNKLRFKKKVGNVSQYYPLDLRSTYIKNDLNVIANLYSINHPFVIFGECTNLYVTENGYNGLFIDIDHHFNGIEYIDKTKSFRVMADYDLDGFVKEAVKKGYDFTNFISIPGLVGSAVCGNSGSEGINIGKHVKSIKVFDFKKNDFSTIIPENGFFKKRNSLINEENKEKTNYLIIECELYADYIGRDNCELKIKRKKDYRKYSDEDSFGTAGSFWRGAVLPEKYHNDGKKVRDLMKMIELNTVNFNGARYVTDKYFLKTEEHTTDKDVARLLKCTIDEIKNAFGFIPENEVIILDHDGRIDVIEFIKRYLYH